MMAELKDLWKQTAKSAVLAFNDLGVSLVESAKYGVDKAVEWARKDNPHYEQAEATEIPTPEEQPAAEQPAEEAPAEEASSETAE